MFTVLVCDDDAAILESLRIYLSQEGYRVLCARDGLEALEQVQGEEIHCMVLDIMMPRLDGLKTTLKLREKYNFPIILLSAKSEDTDKIAGLGFGADDYVTKPFSPSELMARVDAVYRRVEMTRGFRKNDTTGDTVVLDEFELNLRNRTLSKNGSNIELTQVEFQIIEYFFKNPNAALTRTDILKTVWGNNYFGDDKIVDVNIRRLRMKVEDDPSNPEYLTTIWGLGYKWVTKNN